MNKNIYYKKQGLGRVCRASCGVQGQSDTHSEVQCEVESPPMHKALGSLPKAVDT